MSKRGREGGRKEQRMILLCESGWTVPCGDGSLFGCQGVVCLHVSVCVRVRGSATQNECSIVRERGKMTWVSSPTRGRSVLSPYTQPTSCPTVPPSLHSLEIRFRGLNVPCAGFISMIHNMKWRWIFNILFLSSPYLRHLRLPFTFFSRSAHLQRFLPSRSSSPVMKTNTSWGHSVSETCRGNFLRNRKQGRSCKKGKLTNSIEVMLQIEMGFMSCNLNYTVLTFIFYLF